MLTKQKKRIAAGGRDVSPCGASRSVPLYSWKFDALRQDAEGSLYACDLGDQGSHSHENAIPHRHDHFELVVFEGEANLVLDFDEFSISGFVVAFVNEGCVHAWKFPSKVKGFRIAFTRAFLERSRGLTASPFPRSPLVFEPASAPVVLEDAEVARSVMELAGRIHREAGEHREGWESIARSSLHLLLSEVARVVKLSAGSGIVKAERSAAALTKDFLMLVEDHYRERRPVTFFCAKLRISPAALSSALRGCTGQPPSVHLSNRLMLEARRLLQYSRLNVSEISDHLGFEDPSYFTRLFRKQEKMTPLAYRRIHGGV